MTAIDLVERLAAHKTLGHAAREERLAGDGDQRPAHAGHAGERSARPIARGVPAGAAGSAHGLLGHDAAGDRYLQKVSEFTLGFGGEAVRSSGALTTPEMFNVLGLKPALGRFFAEESRPADNKSVLLTQSFWKSHFQEDPGVLGRTMRVDGESYEIIGVAPHSFEAFDARAQFVLPLVWTPGQEDPQSVTGISRLED